MNRIADLLGAWGSKAWKTSKIPGMLRASVGRGLEFGAERGEVAWQSRTVNGGQAVPDPTGHSENKELTGQPSKREEINLFFSCNCFHNCLGAQLHTAILCCLEFPSQLRIRSAMKREQVRQLKLPTPEN